MNLEKKRFFSQADNLLTETKEHKGTSINTLGEKPVDGYMVAIDTTYYIPAAELSIKALKKFIAKRKKYINSDDDYFGTWADDRTGDIHLNVSHRFQNKDEALSFASAKNSLAIYDIKNRESIYIDYDKNK